MGFGLHVSKNCQDLRMMLIYSPKMIDGSNAWNMLTVQFFFRDVTFDKDITPYIHIFIYHAAFFAQKYGPLKAFEMEAVEQLNYVNKLVFFGCSNHGKENGTITEQVHKLADANFCS